MAKIDPERHRQIVDEGRAARAYMQAIIDRHEARKREWEEARERRRRFWRRVVTLGLRA